MTKWKFDQEVTEVFEDMLERSIPQLSIVRKAVTDIAIRHAVKGSNIIDLGCSRGDSLAPLIENLPANFFIGLEASKPMFEVASDRFKGLKNVRIYNQDIRTAGYDYPSVVLSVFTLQFIPINYRQEILKTIYDSLRPGGVFILVEKVLGGTAAINKTMVDLYHELKHENGYSYEEINRKALMLEGVLVPVTSAWNEELLRQAGFESDCFWRWMNFAGWVAYKK